MTTACVLAGSLWLAVQLTANRHGDAGPVVGPGAAEKVRYGLLAGLVIVACAVAVGLVASVVTDRMVRRRRQRR